MKIHDGGKIGIRAILWGRWGKKAGVRRVTGGCGEAEGVQGHRGGGQKRDDGGVGSIAGVRREASGATLNDEEDLVMHDSKTQYGDRAGAKQASGRTLNARCIPGQGDQG